MVPPRGTSIIVSNRAGAVLARFPLLYASACAPQSCQWGAGDLRNAASPAGSLARSSGIGWAICVSQALQTIVLLKWCFYVHAYCCILFSLREGRGWPYFPGLGPLLQTRSISDIEATGDTDLEVVQNSKEKLYVAFL